MGTIIGGILLGYLFGALVGRLFFRNVEPDTKALKSALCGFFGVYLLAGFGYANGAGFNPIAGLFYIPGVIVAWWWMRRDWRKSWIPDDTFD